MRMRMGAPLVVALVSLWAGQDAAASHCGAARFSSCSRPRCDAQHCFSSSCGQGRACYKLVYDTVVEKRFHTCYKTVCETVQKQVTRTCYREETRTVMKPCYKTAYREEMVECTRPVTRTVMRTETCTVHKPVMETHVRECKYTICKPVQRTVEKECPYTECVPVYEQHQHVQHCMVTRNVAEQHMRECCHNVCRQVQETHYRDICCQVSKCVQEQHVRECCVNVCRDVSETVMKECCRKVCKQVTVQKCVKKCVRECVDECYTKKGRCRTTWQNQTQCCFDPCTCKTHEVCKRVRVTCQEPDQVCTRKVWKTRWVEEMVPCTTTVWENVVEKVPTTVVRKVSTTEKRQIPYTTTRTLVGAYVDDKGVAHKTEGPGREFKEGAVVREQCPYTVCKTVSEVVKTQVPYTVNRCLKGAWVDDKGVGHRDEAPGRTFKECATYQVVTPYQTCKMVQVQKTRKVSYCVTEYVQEECVKKVPYQVCKMVAEQVTREVAHVVCEQETVKVPRKVCYTECVMVPHTVRCRVPYTVCETVPCVVKRRVAECVPYDVCVKVCRKVPVDPAPVSCCNDGCAPKCRLNFLRDRAHRSTCCEKVTCTPTCPPPCNTGCGREGFTHRLFRNRFACDPCGDPCATGRPATHH